ncbi:MAG: formate dehydrogenase accessory sulfurtransferase FdhD [Anaerolineae bacterium]|jgi:FdhD protein|nr:formate dehydrogenase accessory sulfurtransferase FdhD [Anaerolineae bacterium]
MDEPISYIWTLAGTTTQVVRLPEEIYLRIHVNGNELLKIAATPIQQEALVVGFLAHAGLIESPEEINVLHLNPESQCVDVWLNHEIDAVPQEHLLTSGCGGGIALGDLYQPTAPLEVSLHIPPEMLLSMVGTLQKQSVLHQQYRGTHASALFRPDGELLAIAEDIGRHNTIDKLLGHCLLQKIDSTDTVLLTTGRVSSEMISKAARLHTPVVASLKGFSTIAVQMAETWNITAVGYVRGKRVEVYTHPERVLTSLPTL